MDTIAARPIAGHAFVEREKQEKTESGLILPDDLQEDRQKTEALFRGKVLALGAGNWDFVKVGNVVLFQPVTSSEAQVAEGRAIFSVPAKAILAVEEA